MMMSDDARSDFVLAAGGAVLIPMIAALIVALPPLRWLPTLAASIISLVVIAASLLLVPWIITRHRKMGLASYGLAGDRSGLRRGLPIALPIVALGLLRANSAVGWPSALIGQAAIPTPRPTMIASVDAAELVFRWGAIPIIAVGLVGFTGFLLTRARDAFREVHIPVIEALRTYGLAAVGVALVTGLLLVLRGVVALPFALGAAGALLLVVLLADRLVFAGMSTTRATILGPAIVTVALHVMATGGPLQGELLLGLWWGALGFGLMVVAASLAGTGATAMVWVLPVVATSIWPSCISPASWSQINGGFCAWMF